MKKLLLIIILFFAATSNSYSQILPFRNANPPQANRGPEYVDYLDASVYIQTQKRNEGRLGVVSGSGTIVYYDPYRNDAYVASCGHLWGESTDCKIVVWYQNKKKLPQPKQYVGKCVLWNFSPGYDTSLVVFKPDWRPTYFAFAPFDPPKDQTYVSTGCDEGTEVAAYLSKIWYTASTGNLITYFNGPLPGRSGGGLLLGGYYVGTCVERDFRDEKVGVYTSLAAIRAIYRKNGYEWLFGVQPYDFARRIPIVNHSNPNKRYGPNAIVIP